MRRREKQSGEAVDDSTNVYIDGFNLYFGCLKGSPYRWLDLSALCQILLPSDQIHRIRYFTARVIDRGNGESKAARQDIYLRALRTIPNVEIHEGHFLSRRVRMRRADSPVQGPRTVEVIKTAEKGSDVNLATYLLLDAFQNDYDTAVVISNDSDLAEPISVAERMLGKRIGIVNPQATSRRSRALMATFFKQIRRGALNRAQFPPVLSDVHGQFYKPREWG